MNSRAIRAAVIAIAALLVVAAPLREGRAAQPAAAPLAVASEQPPEQVREVLRLLAEPRVRAWLETQRIAEPSAAPTLGVTSVSILQWVSGRVEAARRQIAALALALPDLPSAFERAWHRLRSAVAGPSVARILFLLAVFAGLGLSAEWLFRTVTRRLDRSLDARPSETVRSRVAAIGGRLGLGAGAVAAFAAGSLGAFLAFDWPPLLREIVLGYLVAMLATRVVITIGRVLLAPGSEPLRVAPMAMPAARFWLRRMTFFVGWFAFGFVTIGILQTLGFSLPGRQLVAYLLGLGLVAIALDAVWRRPGSVEDADSFAPSIRRRAGGAGRKALMSAAIALLWALWVVRAMPAFWLLLVAVTTPLACRVTACAIAHLLRPADPAEETSGPGIAAVFLDRGVRAALILAAIAVLAWGWGIDFDLLTARDTLATRLLHGAASAVVIALVADVVWHGAKAAIDRALAESGDLGLPNRPEARRRARLRTLLPILRTGLFVVIATVAGLMVLAALGVEIGPLIAGAGIVGIALGFGAQAFVRDVIAGIFYLIDDAFRLGEYIQSGNYKGTVESFGIRSIRLRHHRGPVYTVPFSLLGAVQNMSRDWVIDKLLIAITYDSDLDRAKKLIKQIGKDLAENPDFAPLIIEPLKMQGVEQLREGAVQIRLKIMTLPGEQFVIRRRAYGMIKKAFEENGIRFAVPLVQVAGGAQEGEMGVAVAEQALAIAESSKIA